MHEPPHETFFSCLHVNLAATDGPSTLHTRIKHAPSSRFVLSRSTQNKIKGANSIRQANLIELHSRSYNSIYSVPAKKKNSIYSDSSFRASPRQWQAVVCARALEGTIIQNTFAIVNIRYPVNWAQQSQTFLLHLMVKDRSLTRSHHLALCSGSISFPSSGSHVAQTF